MCLLVTAPAVRPALHAQATGVDTSLEATIAAARTYLGQYQTDLTFVLADEVATQQILRQEPGVPKTPRDRTMSSEVRSGASPSTPAFAGLRPPQKSNRHYTDRSSSR